MIRPPKVRGLIESIDKPRPPDRRDAVSNPRRATPAGLKIRQRARCSRARRFRGAAILDFKSAIHIVPLPPSPATMANSMEPRCEMRCRSTDPRQTRSPGSHLHALPSRRKLEVLLHISPHVLTRGIHQFQFQIIDRAAAAQPKMHRVLLRHRAAQYVPRDDEASIVLEIEIHSQRRNAPREYRGKHELGVAGDGRLPFGENGGIGVRCSSRHCVQFARGARKPIALGGG